MVYRYPGLTQYEHAVSSDLLQHTNSIIDGVRERWWPADGRHESIAEMLCSKLRESLAFRQAESAARSTCRDLAAYFYTGTIPAYVAHTIRCTNRKTPSAANLVHLDRHLLTILILMQLSKGENQNGDLIVYERPPSSLGLRLLKRVFLFIEQNLPLIARRLFIRRDLDRGRCSRIGVTPGNVYSFHGSRFMHANLDVSEGERRSLLIHCNQP